MTPECVHHNKPMSQTFICSDCQTELQSEIKVVTVDTFKEMLSSLKAVAKERDELRAEIAQLKAAHREAK